MIRIADAIIVDEHNRLFLQHRTKDAPTNPDKWGLWGGSMEEGESPNQAICRELKEELEIDVAENEPTLFKSYKKFFFNDDWEGYFFILPHKPQYTYKLLEGDGMSFFSEEDIKKLNTCPISTFVIKDYFAKHPTSPFTR